MNDTVVRMDTLWMYRAKDYNPTPINRSPLRLGILSIFHKTTGGETSWRTLRQHASVFIRTRHVQLLPRAMLLSVFLFNPEQISKVEFIFIAQRLALEHHPASGTFDCLGKYLSMHVFFDAVHFRFPTSQSYGRSWIRFQMEILRIGDGFILLQQSRGRAV